MEDAKTYKVTLTYEVNNKPKIQILRLQAISVTNAFTLVQDLLNNVSALSITLEEATRGTNG